MKRKLKRKDSYYHVRTHSFKKQKISKILEKEDRGEVEADFVNQAVDLQIKKRYKPEWEEDDA